MHRLAYPIGAVVARAHRPGLRVRRQAMKPTARANTARLASAVTGSELRKSITRPHRPE